MKTLSKRQCAVNLIREKGRATDEEIGAVLHLSNRLVRDLLYGLVQSGELERFRSMRDGKTVLGYQPGSKCRPVSQGVQPWAAEPDSEEPEGNPGDAEVPDPVTIQNAFLQGLYGGRNGARGGAA